MPVALYANDSFTFPRTESNRLSKLIQDYESGVVGRISGDSIDVRLGATVIAWNIFKHFFPYWEDASQSPEIILHNAFTKAFTDKTAVDFLHTVRLMCAPLNDGHIFSALHDGTDTLNSMAAPLILSKAENKIVIKHVLDSSLAPSLHAGDIIASIDGVPALKRLAEQEKYISGSAQWKQYKALLGLLNGPRNSYVSLGIVADNKIKTIKILRSIRSVEYRNSSFSPDPMPDGLVKPGVYYFNLSNNSIVNKIYGMMDQLRTASSIIFDLRGYPQVEIYSIINHLLVRTCTSSIVHIPQIRYPDYEKVTYFTETATLSPEKPVLQSNIYFLTDASAMSASESFLARVKDFRLGTIIGEPTAGTNGNIKCFSLPGQYQFCFSGMLVTNHDGSKHHLKGIIPDIVVTPTIKGIREKKDEVLEKAITVSK
jgi:C-terminal processing protease CtpA/Prc